MQEVTIGGERLGSGAKMRQPQPHYNRSNHDLGYIWKNSQAVGTLVPFMLEVGLPGDTFDIKLDNYALTHPTVGPLFGSFKAQMDVFKIPMRLFVGEMMMNMVNLGNDIESIMLPAIELKSKRIETNETNIDNCQINASCILKYLGISGLGQTSSTLLPEAVRKFNGIPLQVIVTGKPDRKSTRLNSSHSAKSRMPSSA